MGQKAVTLLFLPPFWQTYTSFHKTFTVKFGQDLRKQVELN